MVRSGLLRARLRRRTACGKSARAGQVGSERADGDRAGPMRARCGLHFSYIVTRVYVLSETYCLELVHHFTFDARGPLLPS